VDFEKLKIFPTYFNTPSTRYPHDTPLLRKKSFKNFLTSNSLLQCFISRYVGVILFYESGISTCA
jgi:hypothetical protein